MTPLCKIDVTHPRVLGSREVRRGGVVDGTFAATFFLATMKAIGKENVSLADL
jgi:hypothetical protein